MSIVAIVVGLAIGIGIEFGCESLIRLQSFKPALFDVEADREADDDSEENRLSPVGEGSEFRFH